MDIREKLSKFIDDKRLKREIKLAKKEKNEESGKKFNIEKLKDIGLITVAVMLIGVRIC